MENFEAARDALIKQFQGGRRVLLHSCCAPCSSAVLERLSGEGFDVTVYYYNPNVDGAEEYALRLDEQKRLLKEAFPQIKLIAEPYCADPFTEVTAGYEREKEGGARCERCFRLRLRKTAERAKRDGYDLVSTTLTLSPLKNAALLNRIGKEEAEKAGVIWLPADFKKKNGYLRSLELSKRYELYRQNYCGCVYSKNESTAGRDR